MYETFGLTILEAMSLATPVIGFNIGTRIDLIKNDENGFLCCPRDLEKIIIKSHHYNDYERLSKNALKAAEKFQNDKVTLEQIEIYKTILEDK